jgi:signal transduction histidine kinase
LIIILGNIEFAIEDSPEDSPIRHYLQRVEDAAGNARDLVSKLQSFSRQQSLQPQPFNLNAAIEDTVGMLCTVVGKAIALKRYLEPQLHLIVGDVGQIQQILMNLCINARDAMSGGGEIVVTTRNVTADEVTANGRSDGVHDYVLLSVSDDGAGIETEIQPRIFEPFFTTKEIGKGTGLGLSVVYGIVQQHKGFIEIESVKGNGATFKIYFPAHVSSAPKNGKKRSRSTARKDLANYIEQERS